MLCSDEGGSIDIAALANRRIWDFVHQGANLNLRAGTGYYSTPFRGRLFGKVKAADVAEQLSARAVDVLWLGSNPGVSGSLEKIINPPSDSGDFPSFERQIESGFFGSTRWGPTGNPIPDFNPIDTPRNGWEVYRSVLEMISRPECVAMANYVPWGSRNTKALIVQLGSANRPMLQRMVEFADDLNSEIVEALRPKLVVVPLSLGGRGRLDKAGRIGISLKQAVDVKKFEMRLPESTFNFHTAVCQRGKLAVRTLFVRHPSSLYTFSSEESRRRIAAEVAKALHETQ